MSYLLCCGDCRTFSDAILRMLFGGSSGFEVEVAEEGEGCDKEEDPGKGEGFVGNLEEPECCYGGESAENGVCEVEA